MSSPRVAIAAPRRRTISRTQAWTFAVIVIGAMELTYVWRLQDLMPAISTLQIPSIASTLGALVCLFGGYLARNRPALRHPVSKLVWLILVLMAFSIPLSLYKGMSFHFLVFDHLKTVLLFLVMVTVIRNAQTVEQVIIVHLLGCAYYCFFVITRVEIGESGRLGNIVYYDANDLAMLLCSCIPLFVYFLRPGGGFVRRVMAVGALGLTMLTLVRTGSRGGFLGFLAAGLFLLFTFTAIKPAIRIGAVAALAIGLAAVGTDKYWSFIATLSNPTEDYNWSGQAASGRMEIWKRGMGYMITHPLTGVGVDAFPVAEGRISDIAALQAQNIGVKWSAAHNSFVQIGAELGIPGLLAFLAMLYQSFRLLARVARDKSPDRKRERALAQCLIAALASYCVSGFFLSQAYSAFLYSLLALVVAVTMDYARPKVAVQLAKSRAPIPARAIR